MMLSASLRYTTCGWVVHRVRKAIHGGSGSGKAPIDNAWQKVTIPPTEEKLNQWFGNGNPNNYNIGMLCGEASGVTVIDLDRMIYADIFEGCNTLRSSRTAGRGHVYFKYNPNLPASKHHNLGIEVLATGNNVILPPSVHESGDIYKWDNPDAQLAEMPKEIEAKLLNLFKREKDLNALIRKCRPCFAKLFQKKNREATEFHGAEGRELMVAWCTDLKAAGATLADGEMFAKIIYGDHFDAAKTASEWHNIDPTRTWRCETISAKLGGVMECGCDTCRVQPQIQHIPEPQSKTPPAPYTITPPQTTQYFEDEAIYLKIVKELLKERKADRVFSTIFKLARPAFINDKTPSYLELVEGEKVSPYSETSKKVQRSRLKRWGVIDADGIFTESFYNAYIRKHDEKHADKKRLDAIKRDSHYFEDMTVVEDFDYENTMDVIRATPSMVYHLPELQVTKLNYANTSNIQIIKMNHVGGNPVVQLPLSYHYRCDGCGNEYDFAYDVKKVACQNEECGRWMTRVKSQDIIRPAFASRVITDDLNSISIISLTELPQGEFIGAVFVCRNKADYYLFMIATEHIEPTSSTITITQDRHAIWQIIEQIDTQHEDRICKHIHGMEWYKAAILLAYLANCKGRVSTNCMIVGDPGVGKTSTPRFYMATLTPQQKVIDAMQLTGPGLHGSMAQIKIGDTSINVPEAGLLVRHRLVVIDELLENRNSLMPQLKSALMSSTISREVAGNRTQTPKYATAIATSNPVPAVIMDQIKWMNKWMNKWLDDDTDTFSFSAHPAKDAMIEEWTLRGLEWRTGQTLADIDRYPLIFFVRDPSDEVSDFDLGGEDNEIDDLRLAKLLYDSDINEYFSFCGRLKVDWKPHNTRIIELVRELRERDKIHSKKRLGQNITLMLQLSAQINGRCDLTDEDFDFVREFWSKTCGWIDVSELSHNSSDKVYPPQEWTTEQIKKEIHKRMTQFEGSQKYYQTTRGYALIAAGLEDNGADVGLIDVVIEKYKENPRQ